MSLLRHILLASISFSTLNAFAGLPGYKSREIASSNGQYVLVVLTPKAERSQLSEHVAYVDNVFSHLSDDEKQELIEDFENELALEEKYPVGGLYMNDGSTKPAWKIPYISLCQDVHVASDGLHVVVMYSPWDSNCSGNRHLSFVSSGNTVFTYSNEWQFLPFSSFRLLLRACLGVELPVDVISKIDDESNTFTVSTDQGDRLVFDLVTGARLKRSPPLFMLIFLLPLILVPLIFMMYIKLRKQIQAPTKNPKNPAVHFSLADLLGVMAYVACSITLVKLFTWFGGACVLLATLGATVAGFPCTGRARLTTGAILALYGAYVGVVVFAIVDDQMLNIFEVVPMWWTKGWWQLCIPTTMILSFAVFGALIARRMHALGAVSYDASA